MYTKPDHNVLEKLDKDKIERYAVRKKWYPSRVHMTDKIEGSIDCMADESFYRPSILGYAEIFPNSMIAGETNQLQLKYYCGSKKLSAGTTVNFYMRGQSPIGRELGINHSTMHNMKISYQAKCSIEPLLLGFKVVEGALHEGDSVEISLGCEDGCAWTKNAGRYEFKVVFNYGDDRPEHRLPEPLVINVHPKSLDRFEATLTCTKNNRNNIRLHVTARDIYDNRVKINDFLRINYAEISKIIYMTDGISDVDIEPTARNVDRVEVFHEKSNLKCTSNACVLSEESNMYIGDLHVHDFLSEAHQYTDKVYLWALEDRNFDFLSVSIQTHAWIDNDKWSIVKYMNERFLDEGRFVTLLANEWQHTAYGDKVIHYLGGDHPFICSDDQRYNSAPKVYETLRKSDALVISHHSAYPSGSWCSSTNFAAVETDVERLTELWSMHGSSEGFDLEDRPLNTMDKSNTVMEALRNGVRFGFVGGSDTHSGRPGGSAHEPMRYWGGSVAVWARSLTRRDIFEALKARRTCALTGARIILKMTVNDAFIGSEIPAAEQVDIKVDVWGQGIIRKVQIIKGAYLYREFIVEKDEFHISISDQTEGNTFYHCRVIQNDGHLAVCSPIWVG